jgi:phosphonoacetaldehyde hydrolase
MTRRRSGRIKFRSPTWRTILNLPAAPVNTKILHLASLRHRWEKVSEMTFRYQRSYRGALKAVIFDWAGTIVDFGSLAPAAVFIEVFKRQGVHLTIDEARGPMGLHKRSHIAVLTGLESVRARWQSKHGRLPAEADIDRMYADFIPLQLQCLSEYSALVPGTKETVAALLRRGLKIGSTTGYSAEMMVINLGDAARQGFEPDCTISATDVPVGRPSPFMAQLAMMKLGVWPVEACVKIDDTRPGLEEGLNAGMWTVGVAISGNEIGLSLADWQKLPPAEQERLRQAAVTRLYQTGAHYVVDTIADLIPCIDDIEARLERGERP